MVKRVSLFQTTDGAHFETEALAKEHEATVAAKSTIAALLKKLKVDNSFIALNETDTLLLESFLIDNRAALLLALNGNAVKAKATRKKKTAVPETPIVEEKAPVVEEAAAGNSDTQLDSLVAELGGQA